MTPWDGAPWTPRTWQRDAFPVAWCAVRAGGAPLIYAATGSGKSILLSEIIYQASRTMRPGYAIVVCTSRQRLVRQLAATFARRLGHRPGVWYARKKEISTVVVACLDSIGTLTEAMRAAGWRCGLFVADEAHRYATPAIQESIDGLAPSRRIGCTATPFTSDDETPLNGWGRVVVEYRLSQAIRDRALVPPEVYPWTGADAEPVDVATLQMIRDVAPPGPGVVSAVSIEDAEGYAAALRAEGVDAHAIHSQLAPKEQDRLLGALGRSEIRCLVHPVLLTEGVDVPALEWIALRVKRSRVALVQEVGRGLRSHPGKTRCVVLDPLRQLAHLSAIDIDPDVEVARVMEDEADDEARAVDRKAAAKEERARVIALATARRVSDLSAWVERVRAVVDLRGWTDPRSGGMLGAWRDQPSTIKQRDAIGRNSRKTGSLPAGPVRDAVRFLIDNPDALERGAASDLLDVFAAMGRQANKTRATRASNRRWVWPADVPIPTPPDEVTA